MDGSATLSTVESKRMTPVRARGAGALDSPRQNSPVTTLQRNICCTPCVFGVEYVVEDESAEHEIELRVACQVANGMYDAASDKRWRHWRQSGEEGLSYWRFLLEVQVGDP